MRPWTNNIIQFTADMLFPNNNWQRIFCSSLFEGSIMTSMFKCEEEINYRLDKVFFDDCYLANRAREKYGQERRFNIGPHDEDGRRIRQGPKLTDNKPVPKQIYKVYY